VSHSNALRWLISGILHGKYIALLLLINSLISAAASFLFIYGVQSLIDKLIHRNISGLNDVYMTLLISLSLGISTAFLQGVLKLRLTTTVGLYAAKKLLGSLFSRSTINPVLQSTGDVLVRIQESAKIHVTIIDALLKAITEFLLLIIAAAYAINTSVPLTVVAAVCFPFSFVTARIGGKYLTRPAVEQLELQGDYQAELIAGVSNRRIIHMLGGSRFWIDRLTDKLVRSTEIYTDTRIIVNRMQMANLLVLRTSEVAVLLIGSREVMEGNLTPGQLLAFFMLLIRLTNPLVLLAGISDAWKHTQVSLRRIEDLLSPEVKEAPAGIEGSPTGAVELKAIVLPYVSGPGMCSPISLRIKRGAKVAVRGPVGAGKSSLLKVIAGIERPAAGEVLLGKEIASENVRNPLFGYCEADPFFFAGTVKENILIGKIADDPALLALIDQVGLSQLFSELPSGLKTKVTYPVTLSSGQRQAISLVRTLYLSPDILIIDEATSHLDERTEGRFLSLLKSQFPDLTVFLVSHRNAGDGWADQQLHVEKGQILELEYQHL
jgi:ATP-binding cassette subfamily B protein RtxE